MKAFCLVASVLILCPMAAAQVAGGTVVGTIKDASGAFAPNASVVLTNTDTGLARSTVSDPGGNYTLPQIAPGNYRLEVTAQGFKKYDVSRISVLVDQTVRIDAMLEVGSINQEVQVVAAAAQLESETSSLGQVVDTKQVVDLPLNGRNFMQLASLGSGVAPAYLARSAAVSNGTGRSDLAVHISGRGDGNSYLIDGVETRSSWYDSPSVLLSVDAVQEFKVERNMFSAEYGSGSGIVSLVSKSGTNLLHGSAYEFVRNDRFDAANFFDNFFSRRKAPFRQNQYGVSAGGAIIKDKLFFFGDWEKLGVRTGSTSSALAPTTAQLAGNLAGLTSTKGGIIDPTTGSPFPGATIPAARISSVTKKFEQYIPTPNTSGGLNLVEGLSAPRDDNQWGIRIDYQISARDSLFGRYTDYDSTYLLPGLAVFSGTSYPYAGRNATVQETHVISPAMVNSFKWGYTHANAGTSWQTTPTNASQDLGLQLQVPAGFYGLPNITLSNGFYVGGGGIGKAGAIDNLVEFGDKLTWVRGRHNLAFGADIRILQYNSVGGTQTNGAFTFDGRYTGNALGDFLLGNPASATAQLGVPILNLRSHSLNFFAEDDLKLTPRLTLNLGLRYEYNSPYADTQNHDGYFNTATGQFVVGISQQQSALQTAIPQIAYEPNLRGGVYYPDRNNFAPRVGLAYRLTDSTVIRSGYGIFYAATQGNEHTFIANGPPLLFSVALTGNATAPNINWDSGVFPSPSSPAFPLSTLAPYTVDPHDRTPYIQQWNFGVERSLRKNLLLEVTYAGSKGTHLVDREDINQATLPLGANPLPLAARRPFPNFGAIICSCYRESSNYNGLQTRLEKRFGSGLFFLVGYTWSHSLDTSSRGAGGSFHQNLYDLSADRGSSDFDVRQRFTTSYGYDLPFGHGRQFLNHMGPVADRVINGWSVRGITTAMTGNYYSPTVTGDRANVGDGQFAAQRANVSCTGNLPRDQRSVYRWFDTSCFSVTPLNTFGNAGRNILQVAGLEDWDVSLVKNTAITERVRTEFRAEFFNLFNHPQFGIPIVASDNALFGRVQTARAPRQIQFGLKLLW